MIFNAPLRRLTVLAGCLIVAGCSGKETASTPPAAPAPAETTASADGAGPSATAVRTMTMAAPASKAAPAAKPEAATAATSPTASEAMTASADSAEATSWTALLKMGEMPDYVKPGDTPSREDIMKIVDQERGRLNKVIDAIQAFQVRYPQSEHQKDSVAMLVETASSLDSLPGGPSDRAETVLKSIKEMPGLPAETAFRLAIQDFSNRIQQTSDTAKMPATIQGIAADTDKFAERYPGSAESKQLYMALASAIPQVAPAQAVPFFEKLKQSTDPELKAMADAQLRYLGNLGKPADIRFTATNGKEVDLSKMKGKVVLIDFWATWCGPCVAALPDVLEVYKKHHDEGFEIVGISLDENRSELENFVKDRGMDWPQYFDGKRWKNDLAVRFGVQAIPAQWLVDKNGNVVDLNARADLDGKVAALLAGKKID
jgi:thiol-disulfide isomerase/thioredoxin